MTELIFWLSVGLIVYVYAGYPLCLHLLARLRADPPSRAPFQPTVTIIIPAFNEARVIGATIENKLALDYPAEKREIIVVSDESTDGTDDIVRAYADRGVKLLRQEPRQGKTAGLNRAVAMAGGEVLVFSDANSIYAPDALTHLMANFADRRVGYATGKMVYTDAEGTIIGDGCSAYMRYENALRAMESDIGSLVGVDGGIDACRKSLYRGMRADQLPDFVLPLSVVTQGYRVVYEPRAQLKEHTLTTGSAEYRMRVRVALRAMWALRDMRHLLNAARYGIYSWQIFSHKVLRYLVIIPMVTAFIANLMLIATPEYLALFAGQIAFYAMAWKGSRGGGRQPAYVALPYYFTVLNLACGHALYRFLKGEKQVLWTPRVG
jgi:cellulose synthase/poly-beta-1,6-N-acetylglucosamine synthase-like glycosyltransferase